MAERCNDILDHAANVTTEAAARSIAHISAQAKNLDTTNPSGKCWNCGDFTGIERRFCDVECREEYQEFNR